MKKSDRLIPVLVAVAFAGCGHENIRVDSNKSFASKTPLEDDVRRYELGRFAVIEREEALLDNTTILVPDALKREEYLNLLKAATPDLFGGPSGVKLGLKLNSPTVQTVDGYIEELKEGWRFNCEGSSKEQPSDLCSIPQPDYKAMKADWETQLRGHDALVLRDIAKKDTP